MAEGKLPVRERRLAGYRNRTHPVSHIFQIVRGIRDLRHACVELPRSWWHSKAREIGNARRWVAGEPVNNHHDAMHFVLFMDHVPGEPKSYLVVEVDTDRMIEEVKRAAGFRCILCGSKEVTRFAEWNGSFGWPWHEARCARCVRTVWRMKSFHAAQVAMIRKLTKNERSAGVKGPRGRSAPRHRATEATALLTHQKAT